MSALTPRRPPPPRPTRTSADDRFATAAAVGADSEINEQNVERVIRQVLERLGK